MLLNFLWFPFLYPSGNYWSFLGHGYAPVLLASYMHIFGYMIVLMILCFFCCLYFYFFVSTGLEIHAIDRVKSLRVCIPWYSNDVFFLCVFDFFPLLINMENKIIFWFSFKCMIYTLMRRAETEYNNFATWHLDSFFMIMIMIMISTVD